MSLLQNPRYNIQSHGWDYNIGASTSQTDHLLRGRVSLRTANKQDNNTLVAASSPQYIWQLSSCASNDSQVVYIADTAAGTCLSGNATSGTVDVKPCAQGDKIWEVQDEGRNTYTIQLRLDGGMEEARSFLLLSNKTFGLGDYGAGGPRSEFEWAFRAAGSAPDAGWDVCQNVTVSMAGAV